MRQQVAPPLPNRAFPDRKRWAILFAYTLVLCMVHMVWVNFMPLQSFIQEHYQVSPMMAMLLFWVYPLFYVLMSLHAGLMIDRYGYVRVIKIAGWVMCIFCFARMYTGGYYAMLVFQTVIAITQPYIVNCISKLIADWFAPEQNDLATGLATLGILLGMALGAALTPITLEAFGFSSSMLLYAALSTAALLLFLLVAKESNQNSLDQEPESLSIYRALLRSPNIYWLTVLAFLMLGAFNTLMAIFEPALVSNGATAQDAGLTSGGIIAGGLVGCLVLPAISDRWNRRKPIFLLCVAAGSLLTGVIAWKLYAPDVLLWPTILLGFFMLAVMPITLVHVQESAGSQHAGAAVSLVTLMGNVASFLMLPLVFVWESEFSGWQPSFFVLAISIAAAGFAVLRLKEQPTSVAVTSSKMP